jgi:hypothetical protein
MFPLPSYHHFIIKKAHSFVLFLALNSIIDPNDPCLYFNPGINHLSPEIFGVYGKSSKYGINDSHAMLSALTVAFYGYLWACVTSTGQPDFQNKNSLTTLAHIFYFNDTEIPQL